MTRQALTVVMPIPATPRPVDVRGGKIPPATKVALHPSSKPQAVAPSLWNKPLIWRLASVALLIQPVGSMCLAPFSLATLTAPFMPVCGDADLAVNLATMGFTAAGMATTVCASRLQGQSITWPDLLFLPHLSLFLCAMILLSGLPM